jgi:lipopolysaccharide/colanic/teichoic acid biosynthesis glycosyltransferase
VLKLRPGITGPATLKYRLEDEYLANARTLVAELINGSSQSSSKFLRPAEQASKLERSKNLLENLKKIDLEKMSDQEVAVWYNDNVIYPDKVRLNLYYLDHYSFIKDIQMILCTVLGKKMEYAGENF